MQATLFNLNDYQVGTIFSEDRLYRYVLERVWDDTLPSIAFVGLNPSTADEQLDDNTIRKCKHFAKCFGYGRLFMVNLFAFRATQPTVMMRVANPIGQDNNKWLLEIGQKADKVVMAFGLDGLYQGRDYQVMKMFRENNIPLYCLGINGNKTPKHPLYLKNDTSLIEYKEYKI